MEASQVSSTPLRWLTPLRGRVADVALGLVLVMAVAVLIAPIEPWLMDLLIAVNLGGSVLLACLALLLRRPLGFAALPSLLLVTTLLRLSLNVASTRLILTEANAGRIIAGFGSVVVGGDIIIGVVVFGIIALVLFLVVTKGAERVAEVAARFSLDALPGLQAAIEADTRSGSLSSEEAKQRRAELDRQSRYYGSLDGAMKFVRGDAMATMIILGINLIGGVAVGVLRRGLGVGDALDLYGALTIGDGLVSLLPALLTSTAAGLLVTRVGHGDDGLRLGAQLARSVQAEPRAIAAAAALMLLLAALPGLPAWPFLLVATSLLLGFAAIHRGLGSAPASSSPVNAELASQAVVLLLGPALAAEVCGGDLRALEAKVRRATCAWLGPLVGPGDVLVERLPKGREPWSLLLVMRGVRVHRAALEPNACLCVAGASAIERIGLSTTRRLGSGYLVAPPDAAIARAAGLPLLVGSDLVAEVVRAWLKDRACELVSIDKVGRLVEALAQTEPRLVREVVPRRLGLADLAKLLGELAEEGIGAQHLPRVLAALSLEPKEPAADLLERVRVRLRTVISAEVASPGQAVNALLLGAQTDSALRACLRRSEGEPHLALSAEAVGDLCRAIDAARPDDSHAVLLVPSGLRRPLRQLLLASGSDLQVVASTELEPGVKVRTVATVEL